MIISDMSIIELAEHSLAKPEDFGYFGPKDEMFVYWGFCGIDKHGASDTLMESNFKIISQKLFNEFPEDFRIESFKHWAVGYVDRLCVRVLNNPEAGITEDNITKAFREVMNIQIELEDDPIYDTNDYLEMLDEKAISFLSGLPEYLAKMINTDIDGWPEKLYQQLMEHDYFDFEYSFPKDDELLEAAYNAGIDNKNESEEWNNFKTRLGIRP